MTDSPTEGSTSSFSRRSFCAAGVAAVGLVALGGAGSLAFADGNQVWLRPVSYTHLDVYKRQAADFRAHPLH